ncbi:hypothetical protein HAX54_005672 [Datura stramonium]|uniref:Endonuclease/exonuclease/phosphatase domain-containing protein n=1 Tax=Datura stramonium TaxID=4076 RepID=A0ABS8TAD0_DATST|nr:hypothetical protein [Datura stramonium]
MMSVNIQGKDQRGPTTSLGIPSTSQLEIPSTSSSAQVPTPTSTPNIELCNIAPFISQARHLLILITPLISNDDSLHEEVLNSIPRLSTDNFPLEASASRFSSSPLHFSSYFVVTPSAPLAPSTDINNGIPFDAIAKLIPFAEIHVSLLKEQFAKKVLLTCPPSLTSCSLTICPTTNPAVGKYTVVLNPTLLEVPEVEIDIGLNLNNLVLVETHLADHTSLRDEFNFSKVEGVPAVGIKVHPQPHSWLFTAIYAKNDSVSRIILWENLRHVSDNYHGSWLMEGDFNESKPYRSNLRQLASGPPSNVPFKLNVDGSLSTATGNCGIGGVFRNNFWVIGYLILLTLSMAFDHAAE